MLRQPVRQCLAAHPRPAPAASHPPASARTAAAAAASPPAPESGPPCGGCPPHRRPPCSARCPGHRAEPRHHMVHGGRPPAAVRAPVLVPHQHPRLDHGARLRKGTRTYRQSLITRGTGRSTAAARTRSPGWACSTTALSCSTSTTARLQRHRRQRLEARVQYQRVPHPAHLPCAPAHPLAGSGSTLAGHAGMDNAIKNALP